MNEDGSINYDNFADRIDEQIAGGTDAIVVCGTTGESAAMTDEVQAVTIPLMPFSFQKKPRHSVLTHCSL